jgi:hypothetical protein
MANDNVIQPEKTISIEEQLAALKSIQDENIRAANGGVDPVTDPELADQIEKLKSIEANKIVQQETPTGITGSVPIFKQDQINKSVEIGTIGTRGALNDTRKTATKQDSASFQKAKDWRVRISLAPNAKYLYKGVSKTEAGILEPLQSTDGVIFPYTPNISVSYAAGYDATDIAHSNYKVFQYKGSSVDSISITGDFTAQDTNEANYLLAVIHFFRSVTKMFYGQDQTPKNGVPPPLVYLSGFGAYQFDNHPMAITGFTYSTPTDVDYIRAGSQTNMPGQPLPEQKSVLNLIASIPSTIRQLASGLTVNAPNFQKQNTMINNNATYVPTKISITITAIPVVSRNDISNNFSLRKYATGDLLQGSKRNGGGIW